MWNRRWLGPALALVLGSPLLVFPLSWLPRSWAHFRYDCTVPLPEIVLAGSLILGGAALLRKASGGNNATDLSPVFPPHWVSLPVLAVLASAVVSTRFSEHSYFGIGLLPRLCGNVAIFFWAAYAPRDSIGPIRQRWIAVAVLVAANGLVRLKFEPEFLSTLGNWDFLGVYLAASLTIGATVGGTWLFLGNLVLIAAMLFCRSRGAWLALGAVGFLGFLGLGDRILRRCQARVVVVTLALVIASLSARSYIRDQWQTDVRPPIWKATVFMIAARPFLGHGLGTYVAVYPQYRLTEYFLRPKATNVTDHAHNELLEIAAEQGLVGLFATLWLWTMAMWCGIRAVRQSTGPERRAVLGLLGAMLVLILHGLVDVDLRFLPNQSLLWLLMGLLVGRGAAPSNAAWFAFRSGGLKWCTSAVCLILGVGISASAVVHPIAADWLDRQARLAEERGDLGGAVDYASRSLRLEPFRLSTRYLLAGALARSSDAPTRQLAIDQCLQIEEFAPDYADVTYNLGKLYIAANQVTNALPCLRRAVEINPYKMDCRLALASALRDIGHTEEAIQQLDRALQLQPDSTAAGALRQDILKDHAP
ncbi:MAG: O-antigen ligase family protein [Verrucomicrobiia bacterium]